MREVKLSESQLETTRAFVARLGATVGILLYACTIPFLTFFMLKDREKFGRVLAGMLTRNERLGESDVTGAISRTMTAYALGLSFVMLIMAGATTICLMLLRIDYYYVLGPIAGIAILLPYVGVILSTIPAVAVAFFQYDGEKALLVFLVYSLMQFLEGNVLTPYIVGSKVRLFPLTVMKSTSRAFAIISRPTPSFCLPSVTHPRAPIGIERFMSVDVQVRDTVESRPR